MAQQRRGGFKRSRNGFDAFRKRRLKKKTR